MIDLRPVGYVIGLIISVLGGTMIVPGIVDAAAQTGNSSAFFESALMTVVVGLMTTITCQNRAGHSLSIRQAFLLTIGIWLLVPLFAALPLVIGAPSVRLIDAYFEAVSGITTTGASVFVDIDSLPVGVHMWRAMLNWLGGLGIAFIAMIFLPVMRVGGMQFFRTEGFDTFGKILPRATDIAGQLFFVYVTLTLCCMGTYAFLGMPAIEAVEHALATIATGGFSPRAASFADYSSGIHYATALFMVLGSLPYIRYVQIVQGGLRPLWRDAQVRAYLGWVTVAVLSVCLWRVGTSDQPAESVFRESLFNLVSIMSSTGFGMGSFPAWGSFAIIVGMWLGVIGACSGSSAAGLSVFRVQLMFAALHQQIRRIHAPHRIAPIRYQGRSVDPDTIDAMILYLGAYILTFGVIAVLILQSGVDFESAVFASWTSIGNIGYGLGPMLVRTGTFIDFPDVAKLLMILAMIMGRLSLLAVFVVILPRFWRD
ncbi:TrkH family potassium uptake protein [Defluviimonas sp. WL0002]|uniref:Trk system potassium uptake protein n=1 Tax=Albidovulum marisflavi TaxID=2984159 RepID=A0ABT2ZAJ5_9RHOB|nr:TrkH family potassium uptake protein [Defluviimonas sp. WL0002]MCV2868137.1 TrkH family potassium uptake protein [Defluviimonas sp. WL0002]